MIKIAGIQANATNDKGKNLENAIKMVRVAAGKGAKIVCLQELFNTPWFPSEINDAAFELAEEINGKTISALRKEAAESKISVIAPIFERSGKVHYNSAVVIDPDGGLAGVYRKVHVPSLPLYEERHYFMQGNLGFPVFDVGTAKIGVLISWDIFFPEAARMLALKGAEIIFAPTASASLSSKTLWEKSICAGAIANGLFIFRVNRIGKEARQEFYGNSFCANPEGDIIGEPSGSQEGVILCSVDLKMVERTRKEWGFLRDRRPELYTEICKKQ